jgi:zinc protease
MLTKVKEYMLKQHGDDVKTSGYWAGIIAAFRQWGIDMHTDYEQTVKAQTPETISRFVAEVLSSGNRAEVIMQTENKE